MKIVLSENPEIEKIFIKTGNNAVIYFQPTYHAFEKSIGYQTGFAGDENLGWMPFRVYRKLIFRFLQPLYPPLLNGKKLTPENEKTFLNNFVSAIKADGRYHRITQSFIMDVFQSVPDDSTSCPFGQLFLSLDQLSEEQIFSGFQARYRSQIRSALNDEKSIVKQGAGEMETCYNLYREVHERQHMFFETKDFFEQMQKNLKADEVFFYTAYYNQKPQCSALVLLKNKEAYYLFGGSITKTDHPGIIKLMHWEIIRKVKAMGAEKYIWGGCRLSDVEGTKQQGMQDFKMRFGSQVKKGYLWKIDIHLLLSKLYDLLLLIRNKGKRFPADVIDYEKDRPVIL